MVLGSECPTKRRSTCLRSAADTHTCLVAANKRTLAVRHRVMPSLLIAQGPSWGQAAISRQRSVSGERRASHRCAWRCSQFGHGSAGAPYLQSLFAQATANVLVNSASRRTSATPPALSPRVERAGG